MFIEDNYSPYSPYMFTDEESEEDGKNEELILQIHKIKKSEKKYLKRTLNSSEINNINKMVENSIKNKENLIARSADIYAEI